MDESHRNQQNEPGTEDYLPYDIIYIKFKNRQKESVAIEVR